MFYDFCIWKKNQIGKKKWIKVVSLIINSIFKFPNLSINNPIKCSMRVYTNMYNNITEWS